MWKIDKLLFFILCGFATFSFVFSKRANILNEDIVANLPSFQSKNGGFHLTDSEPESAEGTHNALLLSSILGLRNRVDLESAFTFIQSLENGDYGYGRSAGSSSDLKSVSDALWSYQLLGKPVPNPSNVASFVKSLRDESTGMFSNRIGETANLQSTFFAIRILELLNQEADINKFSDSIHELLSKAKKTTDTFEYFDFPKENLAPITAQYFGVYLAFATKYNLANPDKCIRFAASQQSSEGTFFADKEKKSVSLEATVHGLATIWSFQQKTKLFSISDYIDVASVVRSVKHVQYDLKSVANSYLSIALADPHSLFDVKVNYETLESRGVFTDRIVQGTHLRPSFAAKAFGVSHAGLSVDTTIIFNEEEPKTVDLQWKEDTQNYVAEEIFDTSDKLGKIRFDYTVRFHIVGIGEIDFSLEDAKTIGYGITVASTANFLGKEIQEGEVAGSGTEFSFGVTLRNQTKDNFVSGAFNLVFEVLDSSYIPIHTEKVKGEGNTNPFKFQYTFDKTNVPSGILTFQFSVDNGKVTHTVKKVEYLLSTPMVASQISFDGVSSGVAPTYKIGDNVKVTFVPASFSNLRKLESFSSQLRNFFLDIKSVGGVLLRSIQGKLEGERYVFYFPVEQTLDGLGTNVVSFRYVPAVGNEVVLSNYNSELDELFDETQLLHYTVNVDLEMVDVTQKPNSEDFYYGNDINYKFKLRDTKSGKYVFAGEPELANVYLSLQHEGSKGKYFTSVNQSATHFYDKQGNPEGYLIQWTINPNAVTGGGILRLTAQDADGNALPLKGKDIQNKVDIGGNIECGDIEQFTSTRDGPESVFVVEFDLKCQKRLLKDAQLKCSVQLDETNEVAVVPVSTNDDGVYSVSWSLPHKSAPSGNYVLRFYREVDRSSKSKTEPLFEINVPFEGKSADLPVRTELLVVLLLSALFYAAYTRKSKYFEASRP